MKVRGRRRQDQAALHQIADVAATDTAFPRRAGMQFYIQYDASWTRAADTASHVASAAKVYAAMRPFMPGASYVNYATST